MIAVIDYDTGNLCSVANALKRLGVEYRITADPSEIRAADRVLLPGVGEASSAMQKLRERGLVEVIRSLTQPVLGICIGVQLLCKSSEEGNAECLGIFDNWVRKFDTFFAEAGIPWHTDSNSTTSTCCTTSAMEPTAKSSISPAVTAELTSLDPTSTNIGASASRLKIPHIGWNSIENLRSGLFDGIDKGSYVYYVHSYAPEINADTIATTTYGVPFSAAIHKDNFYGTQFHPEKSAGIGAQILQNFLKL